MKKASKMKKRAQKRLKRYESMMSDGRVSNTWKHSSNKPGSGKKS